MSRVASFFALSACFILVLATIWAWRHRNEPRFYVRIMNLAPEDIQLYPDVEPREALVPEMRPPTHVSCGYMCMEWYRWHYRVHGRLAVEPVRFMIPFLAVPDHIWLRAVRCLEYESFGDGRSYETLVFKRGLDYDYDSRELVVWILPKT